MDQRLRQAELEELSAWMDGELPEDRAREVQRLVARDDAWKAAWQEMNRLDGLLDAWQAPAPAGDLAGRIVRSVTAQRQPVGVLRWVRRAAPIAAAAAAVLLVTAVAFYALRGGATGPSDIADTTQTPPVQVAGSVPVNAEVDELIVENMQFFEYYDLVANLETLEAIERLQLSGS